MTATDSLIPLVGDGDIRASKGLQPCVMRTTTRSFPQRGDIPTGANINREPQCTSRGHTVSKPGNMSEQGGPTCIYNVRYVWQTRLATDDRVSYFVLPPHTQ